MLIADKNTFQEMRRSLKLASNLSFFFLFSLFSYMFSLAKRTILRWGRGGTCCCLATCSFSLLACLLRASIDPQEKKRIEFVLGQIKCVVWMWVWLWVSTFDQSNCRGVEGFCHYSVIQYQYGRTGNWAGYAQIGSLSPFNLGLIGPYVFFFFFFFLIKYASSLV